MIKESDPIFMPKVGFRNIKTAIAVLIVMLINVVLKAIDPAFAATWYSPFFAGIAAAYSLQADHAASVRQARIRSMGSIIGGAFGILVVLAYEPVFTDIVTAWAGPVVNLLIFYLWVAVGVIPTIYATVVLKQTSATFVTVLTYLSVTVSIRNNLPFIPFAINRVESTILGVGIALLVNSIRFGFSKNRDVLFVCGLDDTLLDSHGDLTGYTKYKLNSLLDDGALVTIATTRTPGSALRAVSGVRFRLPLILMNGSILFDPEKKEYLDRKEISDHAREELDAYFKAQHAVRFTYSVVDGVLVVHHDPLVNPAEKIFYEKRKNDGYINHVKGELPTEERVIFYALIDKTETIARMEYDIRRSPYSGDLRIITYPFRDLDGYSFLKIGSSATSKEHALKYFVQKGGYRKVIAFGSKSFDVPMLLAADYSIALESADPEVKEIVDLIVPGSNPEDLAREIGRFYSSPHLDEQLEKKSFRHE